MTRLALALTVLLAFAVSACGKDTHESIFIEQKGLVKQIAETLEKMTDASSAKAHKAELRSLGEAYQALKTRSEKLPKPTAEETKVMMGKISADKELQEISLKFQGSVARIMTDPAISAELKDVDFQKLLR